LADNLGISYSAVAKAWREYGVQPWRAETFKFSTNPTWWPRSPTSSGCIWLHRRTQWCSGWMRKSQIEALDRTQPMLLLQPHRPQRHTHD
jgi:hypothetical protein